MDIQTVITLVTILVTLVLGKISKESTFVNNKIIPIQNLCIGIIASIIYYCMTKDFNAVIVAVGIGTGGAYDLVHNLKLLVQDQQWYKDFVEKFIGKDDE